MTEVCVLVSSLSCDQWANIHVINRSSSLIKAQDGVGLGSAHVCSCQLSSL